MVTGFRCKKEVGEVELVIGGLLDYNLYTKIL
jgi:hypothetical protein